MVPEDDLGGVEDLILEQHDMEEDIPIDTMLEDIVAVSSPSSNAQSPQTFNLNEPVEVEVFIPMENGVQMMINPEEIHEDELMGVDELMEQEALLN